MSNLRLDNDQQRKWHDMISRFEVGFHTQPARTASSHLYMKPLFQCQPTFLNLISIEPEKARCACQSTFYEEQGFLR